MRAFIAIDIAQDIKEKIGSLIKELSSPSDGIKWVRPENLHITLKFLGEVKEERLTGIIAVLKDIANVSRPFSLRIGGVGTFPEKKRPRVIWIGVEDSEQLLTLQKEIDKRLCSLGFHSEDRPFTGHITIARLKEGAKTERLFEKLSPLKQKDFGFIEVTEIVLMKSELRPDGARYEKVDVFTLEM